jgi:hypothetical protein
MFQGYKIIFVNGVAALMVVLDWVFPDAEVPDQAEAGAMAGHLWDQVMAVYFSALPFLNVWLRAITTTPVFWRQS